MTSKLSALGTRLPSKRVLLVGLVAVMLVLAGCGGGGGNGGEGTAAEEGGGAETTAAGGAAEETTAMEEETTMMGEETTMMGEETTMMGEENQSGDDGDGLLGGIFSGFFGSENQAAVENVTIYPNGSVFYQNGTAAGNVSVVGNNTTTLENVSVYPNGSVVDDSGAAVGNVTSASGNLSDDSITTQMGNGTSETTTAA